MKMIANGKIPVGLQEAIQQYLQNIGQGNVLPQTPVSPHIIRIIGCTDDVSS